MPSSPPSASPYLQPIDRPRASGMDLPAVTADEAAASFEWSEFFDFTIDEQFLVSLEDTSNQEYNPPPAQLELPAASSPSQSETSDRVRKRDPRMVCSNFLAGRVPCACPELDEKMEEVEGVPGKKKARTARSGGVARCQVPECGIDISELKGYHRRHRVCLRCANATSVLIDGENKRYCQQCGKFHILLDFDEGKRSCRRKLERHNNRRRRKPVHFRGAAENGSHGDLQCDDASSDGEAGRGNVCSSSQITENERALLQDSKDENVSNPRSVPDSHNMQSDSTVTLVCPSEARDDRGKDDSKYELSPSYCNNKSAYSPMCPTGRISFKLYDWNPAEFPRRLRHQIFEWLASMPVELEGYIRPGCTILTSFISMPEFMWTKLLENPVSFLRDILVPGGMLWGRGAALVYLNDRIFRVLRDGASVMKVKMTAGAPKLHYVYPTCFEAGKPIEFVACGSNILRPKFRSLVSFAGRYLAHDYYVLFPHAKAESDSPLSFDYQWCKIYIPYMEPECFGPAFIEVENEAGLSNFLPILIGDKQVCSEITKIQQKYDASFCRMETQFRANNSLVDCCAVPSSTETALSDFILDVAWLLNQFTSERVEHVMTTIQIQRFNCLLNFLISSESTFILERILQSLKIVVDELELSLLTEAIIDADRKLFKKYVGQARDLCWKLKGDGCIVQNVEHYIPALGQAVVASSDHLDISTDQRDETFPSLLADVTVKVDSRECPRKSYDLLLMNRIINSRPLVYIFVAAAVCFGICAVFLHPYEVHRFALTIRRCLFDDSF